MKRKDLMTIGLIAFIAAIMSFVFAQLIFSTPAGRSSSVPVAPVISGALPNVRTDQSYQNIFNSKALDPAQPIQIGGNQNAAPFNGTQTGQ